MRGSWRGNANFAFHSNLPLTLALSHKGRGEGTTLNSSEIIATTIRPEVQAMRAYPVTPPWTGI